MQAVLLQGEKHSCAVADNGLRRGDVLLETETKLFLAREAAPESKARWFAGCPETLDALEYAILQRALGDPGGLLFPDILNEDDCKALSRYRSTIMARRSSLFV